MLMRTPKYEREREHPMDIIRKAIDKRIEAKCAPLREEIKALRAELRAEVRELRNERNGKPSTRTN
jgi:hypothetical protein